LENPPADARAIAETLQRLGASVTLLVDPTRSQLRDALEDFSTPQVQQVCRAPRLRAVAGGAPPAGGAVPLSRNAVQQAR
jgi:hypothetical protein